MPADLVLYHSPNSPFVRKVVIAAKELDLFKQLEVVRSVTSPLEKTVLHTHLNPAGKVPTLEVKSTHKAYFGSQACEAYLDAISDSKHIFPSDPIERCDVLTVEAICDGILDPAVNLRYEHGVRPKDKQWDGWTEGLLNKIYNGLAALEKRVPGSDASQEAVLLPDPTVVTLPIHGIAAHAVLWYLALRYPDIDMAPYPKLQSWGAEVAKRKSCSEPH